MTGSLAGSVIRYGLALGLALAGFFQVIGFEFAYDDSWTIVDNGFIRDPGNILEFFQGRYFQTVPDANRPVMIVSMMLDYQVWRLAPGGYHLHSLILHGVCVILVLRLCDELFADRALSLLAACLFAVHPLHIEPVAAVNYREDLLATMFVLLCLLAGRRAAAGRARWYVVSALCAALAVLSKESALAVVALAVVTDLLAAPGLAAPSRRRVAWYLVLVAVLVAAYGPVHLGFGGDHASVDAEPAPLVDRLTTAPRLVVTYAVQTAVPWAQSPEYDTRLTGWSDWRNAAAALALAAAIAALVWLVRQRRGGAAPWGAAWFAVALLPALNLVPIYNLRADRYLYLPLVGACVAVAWLLVRAARTRRRGAGILAPVVVTGLLLVTIVRVGMWRDGATLWAHAIEQAPGSQRAWEGYATAQATGDQPGRAIAVAAEGLGRFPGSHKLLMARGIARAETGDPDAALRDFHAALALTDGRGRARVLHNIAMVHIDRGALTAAESYLREASQLVPDSPIYARHLREVIERRESR